MPQTCHHLVLSHFNYSNSMLSGLPDSSIHIPQKVQNCAARLVLGKKANYTSTENTKQLHWLPIKQCTDYKVLTLVHKCLHQKAPKYFHDLLKEKSVRRPGLQSLCPICPNTTTEVPHKKVKPLPAKVSVYMNQPNGISYPTPSGKSSTMINSKNYSKHISFSKHITNSSNVKCLS